MEHRAITLSSYRGIRATSSGNSSSYELARLGGLVRHTRLQENRGFGRIEIFVPSPRQGQLLFLRHVYGQRGRFGREGRLASGDRSIQQKESCSLLSLARPDRESRQPRRLEWIFQGRKGQPGLLRRR